MKIKTQTRYSNGQIQILARHGGVQAKRWRQQVANSAIKAPSASFKTLSLPLDLELPLEAFDATSSLYNTVEGFGKGSLGDLLIKAHLAGLSLFQNMAEAAAVRQASAFPTAQFQVALETGMGLITPALTPSAILNVFQSAPRKQPPFTAPEIASRLHSACFGKRMDEKVDASLKDVLMAVGEAATKVASSYSDLKDKALAALEQTGLELQRLSPRFPSLMISLREESVQTVLAYEGVVDPIPEDGLSKFHLHHIVACLKRRNPQATGAQLQDALLSFTNNALSQLFGALLFDAKGKEGYLRTVTLTQFCGDVGIPGERKLAAQAFLDAARTIPRPAFFTESHYAHYRPAVAGKLRSWVSNYLTRLELLEKQLQAQPTHLPAASSPEFEEILRGLDLDTQTLEQLMQARIKTLNDAYGCVVILRGGEGKPYEAAQALDQHLKTISQIHGTFLSVLNQIKQRLESTSNPSLEAWKKALEVADTDIFVLPNISGGNDPVGETLDELNGKLSHYMTVFKTMTAIARRIPIYEADRYRKQHPDVDPSQAWPNLFNAYAEQELQRAKALPGRTLTQDQALELGKRRFLQGIYRLATRLSPANKERVMAMLEPTLTVGTKKCFNRLKFNNQGRIYKSPWSPGRHQPLPINWDAFHLHEDDFYSLANLQGVKLLEYPSGEQLKDFIEIARFAADAQVIQGSDITKDHELWGPLQFLKNELGNELHPKLRLALDEDVIKIATLNALIAWITSQLAKLHFAARRTRFIVRHKFSRVGQDDLIYVPKEKTWEPPPTYFIAKGVISKQLRDIGGGKTSFQARELFQEAIAHPLTDSGALLKQLPHDWYLPLDTRLGIGTEISGLPVGKDSVRSPDKLRRTVTTRACRIKGPSSFLTQFTQMLQSRMENGEWMLILDWGFESQLVNQDGQLQLRATLKDCQARVAIPMKDQSAPEESFVLKDRLVAIDLGERQIGYAVFDIPESKDAPVPQPLVDPRTHHRVNGTIRIPGVRSLINTVKTHRGSQSSNTKLRQNYDTRLEQMRESVTAEIVNG